MPELPEVETTRRGVEPAIRGRRVVAVRVRERRLRCAVPRSLERELPGHAVDAVERRGKYLLIRSAAGTLILHLGMSGHLRVITGEDAPGPHDHLDVEFEGGPVLRLRDPRRFGLALWTRGDPLRHRLLRSLGPEPLGPGFDAEHLYAVSRGRRSGVKSLIMDARVVVGVGNIYASEALHCAGIHPLRPAGRISRQRYGRLVECIREVLGEAIRQGGTTLRDFLDGAGRPGYFGQRLAVYGREGLPCNACGAAIRCVRQAQRSTYYCPVCQR